MNRKADHFLNSKGLFHSLKSSSELNQVNILNTSDPSIQKGIWVSYLAALFEI